MNLFWWIRWRTVTSANWNFSRFQRKMFILCPEMKTILVTFLPLGHSTPLRTNSSSDERRHQSKLLMIPLLGGVLAFYPIKMYYSAKKSKIKPSNDFFEWLSFLLGLVIPPNKRLYIILRIEPCNCSKTIIDHSNLPTHLSVQDMPTSSPIRMDWVIVKHL